MVRQISNSTTPTTTTTTTTTTTPNPLGITTNPLGITPNPLGMTVRDWIGTSATASTAAAATVLNRETQKLVIGRTTNGLLDPPEKSGYIQGTTPDNKPVIYAAPSDNHAIDAKDTSTQIQLGPLAKGDSGSYDTSVRIGPNNSLTLPQGQSALSTISEIKPLANGEFSVTFSITRLEEQGSNNVTLIGTKENLEKLLQKAEGLNQRNLGTLQDAGFAIRPNRKTAEQRGKVSPETATRALNTKYLQDPELAANYRRQLEEGGYQITQDPNNGRWIVTKPATPATRATPATSSGSRPRVSTMGKPQEENMIANINPVILRLSLMFCWLNTTQMFPT